MGFPDIGYLFIIIIPSQNRYMRGFHSQGQVYNLVEGPNFHDARYIVSIYIVNASYNYISSINGCRLLKVATNLVLRL